MSSDCFPAWIRIVCQAVLAVSCLFSPVGRTRAQDQNAAGIVFFLVDDLGWTDTGIYGSSFYETPHIDSLAAGGMRFTNASAASPVCSPTRASLLTGRHPVRVDITDWIPGRPVSRISNPRFQHVEDRSALALSERTLAEVLKTHGYQTCFIGKWHLGGDGHLPTDQGFDINIGGFHAGSPPGGYYSPWNNPYLKAQDDHEYLPQRLADEAVSFLKTRDPDRPFLLYLSWYSVHTPVQPDVRTVDHFRSKAAALGPAPDPAAERTAATRSRQDNPEYASMISAVDRGVGDVLQTLEELNIADRTVVCFFSDNGGLSTLSAGRTGPTSNRPLRAGKGWLYEGGIRVPLLIRAPGITQPGSVSDAVVSSIDLFPTLLDLVRVPLPKNIVTDGVSLRPVLEGSGRLPDRSLYWHYPHYHGSGWTPGAAIRTGRWKLIEFWEEDRTELYDLAADPGEQHDLSEQDPVRLRAMKARLHAWQQAMKARMPRPNPEWIPPES